MSFKDSLLQIMAGSLMYGILWITAILQVCCATGLNFNLSSLSRSLKVNLGDEIVMPCTIKGEGFNVLNNPVIWYKVTDSGVHKLNTMAIIHEPFSKTERYIIEPNLQVNDDNIFTLDFPLQIRGITLADGGTYRCELRSLHDIISDVSHPIQVLDSVKSVQLQTNKSSEAEGVETPSFIFNENEASYVECQAVGGHPAPSLRIYRNDVDITAFFNMQTSSSSIGPEGLEILTYTVTASSPRYHVTMSHDGEVLRCVARNNDDEKLESRAKIRVLYAPKFNCTQRVSILKQSPNYRLSCLIRARPIINPRDITWTPTQNGSFAITVNEKMMDYVVNVKKSGAHNQHSIYVELIINENADQPFQTYRLSARNKIGKNVIDITLVNAIQKITTKSPTVNNPTTTITSLNQSTSTPHVIHQINQAAHSTTTTLTKSSAESTTTKKTIIKKKKQHKHHSTKNPFIAQTAPTSTAKTPQKKIHKKHKHKTKPTKRPHRHKHKSTTTTLQAKNQVGVTNQTVRHTTPTTTTITKRLPPPVTKLTETVHKTSKPIDETIGENIVQLKDSKKIVIIKLTEDGYESGSKSVSGFTVHSRGGANLYRPSVLLIVILFVIISVWN